MSVSVDLGNRAAPVTASRVRVLPDWVPVGLVLLSLPFLRPNILGQEGLSPVGFVLIALAAAIVVLERPGLAAGGDVRLRGFDGASALVICLALAYLWLALHSVSTNPALEFTAILQSIVLVLGSLVGILVVCSDPVLRVKLARGFVLLCAVLGGSYAITALIWIVAGVGSGQIGTFPTGSFGPQPLFFPFTTSAAFQPVFGIVFPRFTGLGREPGWMAMYCAIAFFLADQTGMRRRWVKPLLIVGLIGCVSTAGFGVFVVTYAYHRFLRARGGISMKNYLRQVGGLAAMGLAAWLAVTAPVLGLSAKSTQNATSLDERRVATEAGLAAILDRPLGGNLDIVQGGINLISDIAVDGLPFVVLVIVGLLLTMIVRVPDRGGNAVLVIVLATMLTSQPPRDSTWAFALVVIAATLRRPDTAALGGPAMKKESP